MPDGHTVVMLTTSYPRFPGDIVGTFMEPIAHGVAARGHDVHVVAPWHPLVRRPAREGRVHFHFYRYAPIRALNVFGYAESLRADVSLKLAALAAAPLALAAGWRMARRVAARQQASIVHAHWVIPGGVMGAAAAGGRPLVISLHGSDVYVAERHWLARRAAAAAFRRAAWITACSDDLRTRAIALGAAAAHSQVVPYGVDADRFRPDAAARRRRRTEAGWSEDDLVVFAAGRLVRKKGFEYLLDAAALLAPRWPALRLVIAGAGDLERELRARAAQRGVADRILFPGVVPRHELPDWLAAADVLAVPSVRDDAGNVDGLPNIVLEGLASGTPLVTTPAGGIGSVARDGETALVAGERDAAGLAGAVERLLRDPEARRRLGTAGRALVRGHHGWDRAAERFEAVYERASGRGRRPRNR